MPQAVMPDGSTIGHEPERWPKLLQKISRNARYVFPPPDDIRRLAHDRLFNEELGYSCSAFVIVPFVEDALQIRAKQVVEIDIIGFHRMAFLILPKRPASRLSLFAACCSRECA
jgi:hypothetical protein